MKFKISTNIMILIVIILGAITTQPKISSLLWEPIRAKHLERFMNQLHSSKKFDMRKYWEFREFYSPGIHKFNSKIIGFGETYVLIDLPHRIQTLLWYESPKIQSWDMIIAMNTDLEKFKKEIVEESTSSAQMIFQEKEVMLFKKKDNMIHLISIKPTKSMEDVIGFFDYRTNEQKLLDNKWWVHEALIAVD